jgi:CheY-like chemotaxis protein
MRPIIQILLAEDSPADQRLFVEALRHHELDHNLHIVNNGEEALRVATKAGHPESPPCPDIFVLDLGLPRVDGIDILRAFRANHNCSETPVLVLTSSTSPLERSQTEGWENVHFLQKPLELDEYLAIGKTIRGLVPSA